LSNRSQPNEMPGKNKEPQAHSRDKANPMYYVQKNGGRG
jgi:hypothetical protein